MAHMKNLSNLYAAVLGHDLDGIPKAVIAAIAVSALTQGGDYLEEAVSRVFTEWDILHANGIVPQPVPSRFRKNVVSEV